MKQSRKRIRIRSSRDQMMVAGGGGHKGTERNFLRVGELFTTATVVMASRVCTYVQIPSCMI